LVHVEHGVRAPGDARLALMGVDHVPGRPGRLVGADLSRRPLSRRYAGLAPDRHCRRGGRPARVPLPRAPGHADRRPTLRGSARCAAPLAGPFPPARPLSPFVPRLLSSINNSDIIYPERTIGRRGAPCVTFPPRVSCPPDLSQERRKKYNRLPAFFLHLAGGAPRSCK